MTIWNMEITASESPLTVHIPLEGKYYAIKNTGDHDILVSSYVANPTEGADDVMKIPSGSAAIIPVKDGDLYVSAEEDSTYSISIQDDKVIPWSGGTGSGGGSGGGRTETVLYSAVDKTAGDITLSQAYTDYDVLYVGFGFSDNFEIFRRYMTIPTAMITSGTSNEGSFIIDCDPTNTQGFVAYIFDKSDATKINYVAKGSGNYLFIKEIVGIKYGSGGGGDALGALAYKDTASGSYAPAGSVSVAQSPATYVYDGTTGLTTYTEAGAPSATFTGTTENITVG